MTYSLAHDLGCNLLKLENIPEHLTPILRECRDMASAKTDFRVLGRMSREEMGSVLQQYKVHISTGIEDADTHLGIGLIYLQLRLYDMALRHFKRVVELDPAVADGYYYLALASIRGRRPKVMMLQEVRAVESRLNVALEFDEHQAKFYYLLAVVRQDYYVANGLSVPQPSVPALLDLAMDREYDVWEIERMLASLSLSDCQLLSIIRRELPG